MCGVIGYHSFHVTEEESLLLKNLFIESSIRGMHAYGFSIGRPGTRLQTEKYINLHECIHSLENWLPTMYGKELIFIGHCRYDTSGDWESINNNQPIVSGDDVLVFNGVIRMSKKEEYEKEFGVEYKTDNDGEIALEMIYRYGIGIQNTSGFGKLIHEKSVSYAGISYSALTGVAIACRNMKRPLYQAVTPCVSKGSISLGTKWIASTRDIFIRSGFMNCSQIKPYDMVLL